MNGAIGGGLAGILISLWLYRRRRYIIDIQQLATALLGGLVAITGGAALLKTWHGILIGFIGGLLSNGGLCVYNFHISVVPKRTSQKFLKQIFLTES
jgi:Ammonia permease